MSAAGVAMGSAILAYNQAASAAFFAALGKKKPTPADYAQLNVLLTQARGNAIVDNLPAPGTTGGVSAVAAVNLLPGQPVYVNGTTGQLGLASASVYVTSFVAGLVVAATAAGFIADLATDVLTLQDWTAITGSASLQPGQDYFLGTTPGTLSLIAPTVQGQTATPVGKSVSTTQLLIQPGQPILL